MANKKIRLSAPSKSSAGLSFKVRFRFENNGGHFIVTNGKRKAIDAKKFNNHESALVFAKELQEKSLKH